MVAGASGLAQSVPPYRAGDTMSARFFGGCIVTGGAADISCTVPLDRPVAPGASIRLARLAARVRQGGKYLVGTGDAVEQLPASEVPSLYLGGCGVNFRVHRDGGFAGAQNNDAACIEAELEVEFY